MDDYITNSGWARENMSVSPNLFLGVHEYLRLPSWTVDRGGQSAMGLTKPEVGQRPDRWFSRNITTTAP